MMSSENIPPSKTYRPLIVDISSTNTCIRVPHNKKNVIDFTNFQEHIHYPENIIETSMTSTLVPPQDLKNIVYIAIVMAGVGYALPYNSFIIASFYWTSRFPGRSVALDMSMTYIVVAFVAVLFNNVFLTWFSFRVRVMFGYIISFVTFILVAMSEVLWPLFASETTYCINLVAVALTALGCTVQQSSFHGFASMFPKKYSQGLMTGESFAGFLAVLTRIFSKLVLSSDRISTIIFFFLTAIYIAVSYVLHSTTINLPYVKYYMRTSINPEFTSDELQMTYNRERSPQIISCAGTSKQTTSFSNPVYDLSNAIVDDNLSLGSPLTRDIHPNTSNLICNIKNNSSDENNKIKYERFGKIRNALMCRLNVAHAIYPYMVCIALAYCVTLSLYPGIESEIVSCTLKSWMPVLLMLTFNTADLIGKVMAAIPYDWSKRQLILLSGMRTVLIPLLLLCCAPRNRPIIAGESSAFVFIAALGLTNGLAGSLPMMLAPSKIPETLKEITGNMMTLSYNMGLTLGCFIGYIFDGMIGPPLINPCPVNPYNIIPSSNISSNKSFYYTTASTFFSTNLPNRDSLSKLSTSSTALNNMLSNIPTILKGVTKDITARNELKISNKTLINSMIDNTTEMMMENIHLYNNPHL